MTEVLEQAPVVVPPTPARPNRIEVFDPVPVLDTGKFEHMNRIALAMARTTLLPDALTKTKNDNGDLEYLKFEEIVANCFLVVNQAVRWGLDPFAVASCVSIVHGKLCYEGKLISAVIDAKLGIKLHHLLVGNPASDDYRIYLCDRPFDEKIVVIGDDGKPVTGPLRQFLEPGFRHPGFRLLDGSVGEWKTTGKGSPWHTSNYPRMLLYRGTRDWTRIYESAILLGVYTQDEMGDLADNARARRAAPIETSGLAARLASNASNGFNAATVDAETAQPAAGQGARPDTVSLAAAAAEATAAVAKATNSLAAKSEPRVVDWSSAKDARQALEAGMLPPGYSRTDTGALMVPDDVAGDGTRGHSFVFAHFDEIITTSGEVLKSKSVEPAEEVKPAATEKRAIDLTEATRQGRKAAFAGDEREPPEDAHPDEQAAWLEAYDAATAEAEEGGA